MSAGYSWMNERRKVCTKRSKRELQPKRNDHSDHDLKDSQSVVPKMFNAPHKVKRSKNALPNGMDAARYFYAMCDAWTWDSGFLYWIDSNTSRPNPKLQYVLNEDNNWVYGRSTYMKTSANAGWLYDNVGTSKTNVSMLFAVVHVPNIVDGFLGIGRPDWLESDMDGRHPSFTEALKNAGYIQKSTYSLFLNNEDAKGGSILFGAVDHEKYVGNLQTVPMITPPENNTAEIAVVLNKLYLENSIQKVVLLNESIPAMFEATDDEPYFPKNIFDALVDSKSASYRFEHHVYQVNCGYRNSSSNLVYEFSGILMKIPLKELVDEFVGICYLAAKSLSERYPQRVWLNNSFLRYVYMNVDLETEEVSMAEAKYSDQEEIEKITTTVPGAVKAKQYASTSIVSRVKRPSVDKLQVETEE